MRFISSAENGNVGDDLCFGALTLVAGFRSIHRACSQNRKNARIRSRFFVAYTAPSSHVVLNSRTAPTSICFSSRKPLDSHQPMNRFSRRFLYLRTVSPARCRAFASSMNFVTASATVGTSGLTTPTSPDASQPRTSSEAASQERRSRLRRTYSPRSEPWTQIGHLQFLKRREVYLQGDW